MNGYYRCSECYHSRPVLGSCPHCGSSNPPHVFGVIETVGEVRSKSNTSNLYENILASVAHLDETTEEAASEDGAAKFDRALTEDDREFLKHTRIKA